MSTCETLLRAALNTEEKLGMLVGIAIGLFASIRPEESLSWQHVHLEERFIEVPDAIAKTRKRRIVAISENLAALLKAAGITYWPHDVLRHCFAS